MFSPKHVDNSEGLFYAILMCMIKASKKKISVFFYVGVYVVIALFGAVMFLGLAPRTYAAAFGLLPFAGRIKNMDVCNDGYLLYLGPPSGFPVLVPYGKTFLNNVFRPGGIVIGLDTSVSVPCTIANTIIGYGLRAFQAEAIFVGTGL